MVPSRRFRTADVDKRALVASWRPAALTCGLVMMAACSSFFKLTPEGGDGAVAKPAATKPAEKPADKPAAAPKPQAPARTEPKVEAKAPPTVEPKAPAKVEPKIEPKTEPKIEPKIEKPDSVKQTPAPKPANSTPQTAAQVTRPLIVPAPETKRPEPIIEPPVVEPAPEGSDSAAVARLMHAAALWDAVRLFHPAVSRQSDEWDNATVRRLTDVRSARTRQQYLEVMQEWLSRLDDPITHVYNPDFHGDVATGIGGVREVTTQIQIVTSGSKKKLVADTTHILTWPLALQWADTVGWSSLRAALQNARNASQIVIDLRSVSGVAQDGASLAMQLSVASALTSSTIAGPSVRRRVYEGWPDEGSKTSSRFGSAAWRVGTPLAIVPGEATVRPRRIVLVAGERTTLPPALLALVSNKRATLVSEGPLSDQHLIPTTRIALGQRLEASVRMGELINADGSIGIQPDTVLVPAAVRGDSAPALRVALLVARGKLAPQAPFARGNTYTNSNNAALATASWNTAHYPIMGARLLAAFKMWGTLRAFHAYGDLRDENLDDAFARFIPRVEAAADAYSYAAAMLDFASTVSDAQAVLTSPTLEQHIGGAAAPFRARWIEGRAIVTQVAADDAGRASGLSVGDEIVAADGYPMPAYVTEHRRYSTTSNEWTRYRNTMDMIPRGVAGEGLFRVRDASNRERSVNIERKIGTLGLLPVNDRSATSVFRELSAGIGYVDLDRINQSLVSGAFEALSKTRAIIFDARGAAMNRENASDVALAMKSVMAVVATQPNVVITKQSLRVATEPCPPLESRIRSTTCVLERRQFDDIISADTARPYRGRVVVLIDERTQGLMEQTALGLESVANAVFIGSPSAGAAGAITNVVLPGNMTLSFSGTEVRRADGGQLQRVGISPQVEARPTAKGIRAGTDEVLEKAQQWLVQQLDPPAVRRRR